MSFLGFIGAGTDLDFVERALERVTAVAPASRPSSSTDPNESSRRPEAAAPNPLSPSGISPLYRAADPAGPERRSGMDEMGVPRRRMAAAVQSTAVHWSVIASVPQALLHQQRKLHAIFTMGSFAAGALLAGLAVALFLSRQLAKPVAGLSTSVEAIGKGDLRGSSARQGRLSPARARAPQTLRRRHAGATEDGDRAARAYRDRGWGPVTLEGAARRPRRGTR